MEGEELTEQETALYDRQIRVWGVDAQRRSLFIFYCNVFFASWLLLLWFLLGKLTIFVHFRALFQAEQISYTC